MKKIAQLALSLIIASTTITNSAIIAHSHGYIGHNNSDITARAKMPGNQSSIGAIRWEPQSLEAPKGFPTAGPEDGKLASANCVRGCEIDEQSADKWVKNKITPGNINLAWTYTAKHSTSKWHYYITKDGWNQNAPLTRDTFEHIKTVEHDKSMPADNAIHTLDIAQNKQGYHVIYAIWDIHDTENAFYNVIDVDIQNSGSSPKRDGRNSQKSENSPEESKLPQDIKKVKFANNNVEIAWQAPQNTENFSHYAIYRDNEIVGTTKTTSFIDGMLQIDEEYGYTVNFVDKKGKTFEASDILVVIPANSIENPMGPTTDAPSAPSNVHSMGNTDSTVDLMWKEPENNETNISHYTVIRNNIEIGRSNGNTYLDTGLEPGTTYSYTINTVGVNGQSQSSETFTTTTKTKDEDVKQKIEKWDPNAAYTKNSMVEHNGIVYIAVQDYKGNSDPNWINAPSLWKKK